TEQGDHVVDVGGIDVVADDEIQAIVSDKPQRVRKKRKVADGASGSGMPPKKLREYYGIYGIGASTGRKSAVVLQGLLEGSTLAMEVRVTAAATMPFVTSSVTPTLEREGPANFISGTGLQTQHPVERFMISSDSPHDSNANDVDNEVTSIVRSSMPPPPVLTAAVATTIVAGAMFAPVHESGTVQDQPSFFRDSASPRTVKTNEYDPRWNVINESALDDPDFNVGAARQTCLSAEVRMRLEHEIRGRKRFEGKCAIQDGRDSNTQVAKVTQDLSNLHLSCDELSVKASSLEFEKDKLVDQVSALETTCSDLRNEVMGYKLLKEQIEAVQDV
ncbi:hypothetical protein Tco_0466272, partial [Tanacetum coccineum]